MDNLTQPAKVELIQGTDDTIMVQLFDPTTGQPFDLTLCTAFNARFPGSNGTPIVKGLGTGVTVVGSPVLGKANIQVAAADITAMPAGDGQNWQINGVVNAQNFKVLFPGGLKVDPDLV